MLLKEEKELIKKAKELVQPTEIRGGEIKEAGCALITEKGEVFLGVNLDLNCGIGFCAEHSAISQMITRTEETHIKTIVAVNDDGVSSPCGRCRELMSLLDAKNMETEIIISDNIKVKLKELLPFPWNKQEK